MESFIEPPSLSSFEQNYENKMKNGLTERGEKS